MCFVNFGRGGNRKIEEKKGLWTSVCNLLLILFFTTLQNADE
ncbi:hypothetical protein PORCAN_944 [Porphyromonas crevioricanis JCM 13913]|nr:hypothetical protein PORCAN_944 [Porphyromonas crevioricanis JCM 13913]